MARDKSRPTIDPVVHIRVGGGGGGGGGTVATQRRRERVLLETCSASGRVGEREVGGREMGKRGVIYM